MAINLNKFTIKAQEVLQEAGEIASSYSNQQIEPEHLFAALIQNDSSIAVSLIRKIGADINLLRIKIAGLIEQFPKVSSASASGQFLSAGLQNVLDESVRIAAQLKDEYISIEHILIALAEAKGKLGDLLNSQGVTRENNLNALREVRGSQRVTNQDPEQTYQSLKKYGRDLNQLAKQGKLDPVIGRDDEIRRVLQVLSRRTKNNPK
jgi:ATP-dependent Clp protease ATP-binding subunit ClpB